ncbi:ribose import ATP-binding protein RbsA [Spirochaetia bacterium]|nr:ribose import ATP-binding protein RbsA [Spirochaetia bacterium]
MDGDRRIILEGKELTKQFYGNTVLNGVSIRCHSHTVLALVGENGAGKSTLMNIISGGLKKDSGTLLLDGKPAVFRNSRDARKAGISFVHQELSLFGMLTVGENIMLGMESGRRGFINQTLLHTRAGEILTALDYTIDVNRLAEDLNPAEKQIVEIAKAWAAGPWLLILDEPTSSLNKVESDKLFRFVRKVRDGGVSVILITHRMEEIFEVCDEAIVLRDGVVTASEEIKNLTRDILIGKMVGREVTNTFPPRAGNPDEETVLELKNAAIGNVLKDVNLEIHRGTVVGIGGLEGQGQRHLIRALFGVQGFTGGEYLLHGKPAGVTSPSQALKAGLAFIPDDRKSEGLALPLPVQENMVFLILKKLVLGGFINSKKTGEAAAEGSKLLNIKYDSPMEPVMNLSGGNQQKVIFAKWIKTNAEILLLHEPTRGVDVQSKLEIYALIRELTGKGISVLLVTSDMLELIGMSDRIYVMYEGRVSGIVNSKDATEEKLMALSSGMNPGGL